IPAGASEFRIPVKFFRTSDILDKAVELTLKLEDNEHFKVYFNTQKNTNVYNAVGETIRADRFVFSVSEIYTLPSYWQLFGDTYFGSWSVAKNKYINSVVGWTQGDWLEAGSATSPV